MPESRPTVLVTGATGNQGSAVVQHLLASGQVAVRCLVRDINKASSRKLDAEGASLSRGSFDDVSSLRTALEGCYAVFLNTMPGPNSIAVQHTRNVLNAAPEEGVLQVVCSTVCRAGEHRDFKILKDYPNHFMLSYWEDKEAIERLVKQYRQTHSAASWTIIQPAWLMSNFTAPAAAVYWSERLSVDGVLATAFDKDTKVQLTSGDDVGACATAAILESIQNRGSGRRYDKKVVRIASDSLSVAEIAATMSQVSGRQITAEHLSLKRIKEEVSRSPYVFSQRWATVDGTQVDMESVEELNLGLSGFRAFLERNRDALVQGVTVAKSA